MASVLQFLRRWIAPAALLLVGTTGLAEEATLTLANREVMVFRAPWVGISAGDRMRRASQRLDELLALPGAHRVAAEPAAEGWMLQIDGATVFMVTAADADATRQETAEQVARRAAARLLTAVDAAREARDPRLWGQALLKVGRPAGLLWRCCLPPVGCAGRRPAGPSLSQSAMQSGFRWVARPCCCAIAWEPWYRGWRGCPTGPWLA